MIMARTEFEIPPAGDDAAEVRLAGELRAAVNRARAEHRMTFAMLGGGTAAAIVPVGVAVAMEPSTVQLAGDTCWTELPSGGVRCPAGHKIVQVEFYGTGIPPKALHDDGTPCTHTRSPVDEPA